MDEICRLCLTVSVEMACKLGDELSIFHKLSRLNIKVDINDSLPSFVCCTCFTTIDKFQNFVEKVKHNDLKLIDLLNRGVNLNKFYESLKHTYVSIENLKTEVHYEDDNNYCDDPIYYELEFNKRTAEINLDKNCDEISQTPLNKEISVDKNVILSTNLPRRHKRKIVRHSEDPTKGKARKNDKLKTINTINIKHNSEKDDSLWDNAFKTNADTVEPKTETRTEYNEAETNLDSGINTKIDNKEHKCLTCFEYLISQAELIKHYKAVHTNFSNKDIADTNVLKSKESDPESVLKVNSNGSQDQNQMNKIDSNESNTIYNCKICGRTFSNVYAIIRHGASHSALPMHCSQGCGYSTVYSGALRDHEKRHNKDYKYKCTSCGAGFHVKTWYDQHQNMHKNIKPFVCDTCGMAFHMHRYLTSHRTSVHPELWKGSKRYICPHCELPFFNVYSYRTHLEEHVGKKTYLCDLCGKVCSSSEQLKYHKNAHLGVKPYTCSICNKKFAKKFNLTVHEKAHSGEKHLCQSCGKYFAQKSTLLRHSRRCHPVIAVENISTGHQTALNFSNS